MSILGGVGGLMIGGLGGFYLGRWLRCRRRWWYWGASAACLLLGVGFIFMGQAPGFGIMAGLGIGFVTGGLNGIKYGAGRLREWRGGCGGPFEDGTG
jgi:hypothetical protein